MTLRTQDVAGRLARSAPTRRSGGQNRDPTIGDMGPARRYSVSVHERVRFALETYNSEDLDQASIREFRADDFPALAELAIRTAEFDRNPCIPSIHSIREAFDSPFFRPATDCFVAQSGKGHLLGYAYVVLRGDDARRYGLAWGSVHPDYRCQRIGTRLLRAADARFFAGTRIAALASRPMYIERRLHASNRGAALLAAAEGYTCVRSVYRMRTTLDRRVAPLRYPDGITLRPFVAERDSSEVSKFVHEIFAPYSHPAFPSWDDHWLFREIQRPDFVPALWLVAVHDGSIAGIALSQPWRTVQPHLAWLSWLGVHRRWRRRGVGRALLGDTLRGLQAHGFREVALAVRNADGKPIALYERAGMHIDRHYIHYRKWAGDRVTDSGIEPECYHVKD